MESYAFTEVVCQEKLQQNVDLWDNEVKKNVNTHGLNESYGDRKGEQTMA